MADTVKAKNLAPGDSVRRKVSIEGEWQDVELIYVGHEDSDGEDVVVLRFEVEGGVITQRVPPDEELARAGS